MKLKLYPYEFVELGFYAGRPHRHIFYDLDDLLRGMHEISPTRNGTPQSLVWPAPERCTYDTVTFQDMAWSKDRSHALVQAWVESPTFEGKNWASEWDPEHDTFDQYQVEDSRQGSVGFPLYLLIEPTRGKAQLVVFEGWPRTPKPIERMMKFYLERERERLHAHATSNGGIKRLPDDAQKLVPKIRLRPYRSTPRIKELVAQAEKVKAVHRKGEIATKKLAITQQSKGASAAVRWFWKKLKGAANAVLPGEKPSDLLDRIEAAEKTNYKFEVSVPGLRKRELSRLIDSHLAESTDVDCIDEDLGFEIIGRSGVVWISEVWQSETLHGCPAYPPRSLSTLLEFVLDGLQRHP